VNRNACLTVLQALQEFTSCQPGRNVSSVDQRRLLSRFGGAYTEPRLTALKLYTPREDAHDARLRIG
jgi:hypothetical protein